MFFVVVVCLFAFLFVLALLGHRIKVIEKSQVNNYRLPHGKKTTICPWKFPEIRPGIFDRMVSALNLKFFFSNRFCRRKRLKAENVFSFLFHKNSK